MILKEQYRYRERRFKEIRKQIKIENKCSWADATECACNCFDGFFSDHIRRMDDIVSSEQLIQYLNIAYQSFEKERKDFYDRELGLLYSTPLFYISIFRNKLIIGDFQIDKQHRFKKAMKILKEIAKNNAIKEIYRCSGEDYRGADIEIHVKYNIV